MKRLAVVLLLVAGPALAAVTPQGKRLDTGACKVDDRVAALDLVPTPASGHVGEPSLLTLRVAVHCPAPIAWRIEGAGRVLASGTNEAPPPGGILTIAATWTPRSVGDVTLRAIADPDNALGETEPARKNNVVTRTLTVAPPTQPIREQPEPAPPPPNPPPPPDEKGEPGTKGTCTAWERHAGSRGEGLIAVRRARGAPSAVDYGECARRLALDVAKSYCSASDRQKLAKKTWYLQPGDLALVPQTIDCR